MVCRQVNTRQAEPTHLRITPQYIHPHLTPQGCLQPPVSTTQHRASALPQPSARIHALHRRPRPRATTQTCSLHSTHSYCTYSHCAALHYTQLHPHPRAPPPPRRAVLDNAIHAAPSQRRAKTSNEYPNKQRRAPRRGSRSLRGFRARVHPGGRSVSER